LHDGAHAFGCGSPPVFVDAGAAPPPSAVTGSVPDDELPVFGIGSEDESAHAVIATAGRPMLRARNADATREVVADFMGWRELYGPAVRSHV